MSGHSKKRASQAKSPTGEDEGISLVVLYSGAAVVGGLVIVSVAAYLLWPAAAQLAVVTAEAVTKPGAVADDARRLITASINLEFGEGAWSELEFRGPIPADPVLAAIAEQLTGDTVVVRYSGAVPGGCFAQIVINVRPRPGKRSGRDFRTYWVRNDRSLEWIKSSDPEWSIISNAVAAASKAAVK